MACSLLELAGAWDSKLLLQVPAARSHVINGTTSLVGRLWTQWGSTLQSANAGITKISATRALRAACV
eukprot:3993026-Karenia_brevis.AAC.1